MAILTLLYRMFTVPLFGLLSFLVTLTTPIWLPFKLVLLPLLYLASAVYDARTLPATIFAKVEVRLYVRCFLKTASSSCHFWISVASSCHFHNPRAHKLVPPLSFCVSSPFLHARHTQGSISSPMP